MANFRLDNKVALVTGASKGLGRAIAHEFLNSGARVVGLSRSEIDMANDNYRHLHFDLANADQGKLTELINDLVKNEGRIDILVNNAGMIRRSAVIDYAQEDWDIVQQVNLRAAFFLSQAAAKHMQAQGGGKIINVASVLGYQGGLFVPAYTSTKHAIIGITRSMANEWAKDNINVNAIAPGYFSTDMTESLENDPERHASITSRIPAGRFGQPSELAGAVVFLASAAANYMHGSVLTVDGGWLSR